MRHTAITAWASGTTYPALDTGERDGLGNIVYAFTGQTMCEMYTAGDWADSNGGGIAGNERGTWSDFSIEQGENGITSAVETPLESITHDGITYWVVPGMALDEAPRTYAVGLPVFVTVHPDGHVSIEVDYADAGDAIAREHGNAADGATVDDAITTGTVEMI